MFGIKLAPNKMIYICFIEFQIIKSIGWNVQKQGKQKAPTLIGRFRCSQRSKESHDSYLLITILLIQPCLNICVENPPNDIVLS